MTWIPIRYRDFYDRPRAFVVEYHGTAYFFDAPFDEMMDDYPDRYKVYRLNHSAGQNLDQGTWGSLANSGELLGEVPLSSIQFDETLRQAVHESVFVHVLKVE